MGIRPVGRGKVVKRKKKEALYGSPKNRRGTTKRPEWTRRGYGHRPVVRARRMGGEKKSWGVHGEKGGEQKTKLKPNPVKGPWAIGERKKKKIKTESSEQATYASENKSEWNETKDQRKRFTLLTHTHH